MTKDCQCHRLFYPTLIRSRSSNHVNSLKIKTTISPVITTLRTIGVIQRKKRKNEDLGLRSKLSKFSFAINRQDPHPVAIKKRTFPQDLFDRDCHQFKQDIWFSNKPQSFHSVGNGFFVGFDQGASMPKQAKFAKPVADRTESSQTPSNSNTDNRGGHSEYHSPEGIMVDYHASRKQSFSFGDWKVRPIPIGQDLSVATNSSPAIGTSENREELIFSMSPFSLTETMSTFMKSPANQLESHNSPKGFDRAKDKCDNLSEDSDDDENERSVSITSVLPIDIPQSHQSS
ncbi:hypothetical protein H4Q26_005512 [Puccinia striiformis f. sp. tritici PST-130]|nr:hypothetical protein Pst134EB_028390 [Puccinia striiformis f. sp. tritici]KAI9608058.1 hypothetical protein H4Q26_005512 [Puccinia striiformis f. sp. tritici PST-130]